MYTLKEIAERWNKTENDILRMAGNGSLQIWTYVDFYGFDFVREKEEDGVKMEGYPRHWVYYSPDEKYSFVKDEWIGNCSFGGWFRQLVRVPCQYLPGLIVNETIKAGIFYGDTDLHVYMALEENFTAMRRNKIDIPPTKRRFTSVEKKALCVKMDEVTSMEKKHPELVSVSADNLQNKLLTSERETTQATIKRDTGLSDIPLPSRESEKPLKGAKEIAAHLEIHESTLKAWRQDYKDIPILNNGGRLIALPSELNGWMMKKKT